MTGYERDYGREVWDEDDEDVGTVEEYVDFLAEGEPFEEDGGDAWAIREFYNEHPADFADPPAPEDGE